jgi:gamma-glutamyltranspeptidase/glutathione hydrolase/leukotriene-C4 hydrolase
MAVAITSTVNLVFGSQVLEPVTGIILNDELDDFATPGKPNAFGLWPSPCESSSSIRKPCSPLSADAHASDNYPAPGKRPLSSTAPTILEHEDGSFYLALGGSGGSKIFGSIAQVILGADIASSSTLREGPHDEDWIDISKAVEAPRAHDQLFPLRVEMDSTFDQEGINELQARGHNVTGQR